MAEKRHLIRLKGWRYKILAYTDKKGFMWATIKGHKVIVDARRIAECQNLEVASAEGE